MVMGHSVQAHRGFLTCSDPRKAPQSSLVGEQDNREMEDTSLWALPRAWFRACYEDLPQAVLCSLPEKCQRDQQTSSQIVTAVLTEGTGNQR